MSTDIKVRVDSKDRVMVDTGTGSVVTVSRLKFVEAVEAVSAVEGQAFEAVRTAVVIASGKRLHHLLIENYVTDKVNHALVKK